MRWLVKPRVAISLSKAILFYFLEVHDISFESSQVGNKTRAAEFSLSNELEEKGLDGRSKFFTAEWNL